MSFQNFERALSTRPDTLPASDHPLSGIAMTGADIVVQVLADQAVDTIFGYPGARTLLVHDALLEDPDLNHYLVRHEQGAAHAADGYARTTNKVGVLNSPRCSAASWASSF